MKDMATLPEGTFRSLSDIPEQQRAAAIQVGPYYYNAGLFFLQAQAAFAKALVFAAQARVAVLRRELIGAAIANYYALFHFSLALIFVLPEEIDPKIFQKLMDKRQGGKGDPTGVIAHRYIPEFLKRCESRGLASEMRSTVERARTLREFVNYGPRAEWADDKAIFRSMKHKPEELEEVIQATVPLFQKALDWAKQACNPERPYAQVIEFMFRDFITKPDLFYVAWCSPEVLEEADRIAASL
jgi:hypothetical protein